MTFIRVRPSVAGLNRGANRPEVNRAKAESAARERDRPIEPVRVMPTKGLFAEFLRLPGASNTADL